MSGNLFNDRRMPLNKKTKPNQKKPFYENPLK